MSTNGAIVDPKHLNAAFSLPPPRCGIRKIAVTTQIITVMIFSIETILNTIPSK